MEGKLTTGEKIELFFLGSLAVAIGWGAVYTLILFLEYLYQIG
jgi:hypothetical protein